MPKTHALKGRQVLQESPEKMEFQANQDPKELRDSQVLHPQ